MHNQITIGAALRSVANAMRRRFARWQLQQRVADTYLALYALDARTLRDLGLHRSEILSVANELAGDGGSGRVRFTPIRRSRSA